VQAPFLALLASKLKPGAYVHVATDWEDYARQMLEVFSSEPALANTTSGFASAAARPQTKFEDRGRKLGHRIWDLVFRKIPPPC
jgi:tRNA (guanine-N7-)-methyltransferase